MSSAVFICGLVSLVQPASRLGTPGTSIVSRSGVPACALPASPAAADAAFRAVSSAQEPGSFARLQQQSHAQQQRQEQEQQQQQQQQAPQTAQTWVDAAAQGALALLATVAVLAGDVRAAHAENELATLAASKSTSELVDPSCFARSCKSQMEACANDGDCMKGLACTAKCLGDAQCTVGCFARYNDANLEKVLQCTIEDAACIAIATQAPGGDTLAEAPTPPKPIIKATPTTMGGRWYKVMGFNPNYDCFECQRNSFASTGGGASAAAASPASRTGGQGGVAREAYADINGGTAAVQVEYAMPRARIGQPTEIYKFDLNEKLEFDAPNSKRTAHTEGRMFGLTFWENWYVIGENQPREPEFRFVYYTGKTLQNRYEGAFVYSRKPELPANAMPSIYKIAREAGLDPQRACCIDNSCFGAEPDVQQVAAPPLFTPVAEAASVYEGGAISNGGDGVSLAGGGSAGAQSSGPFSGVLGPVRNTVRDITELLEDPKPYGVDLFARQKPMTEVREYDINGLRSASPIVR